MNIGWQKLLLASAVAFLFTACRGAGPYGHAVNYVPLEDEEKASTPAKEYDAVMFQREPDKWHHRAVSLFGVVTGRGAASAGSTYVTLSLRQLEPRNLCENGNDEDSCRVTVSDREFGVVHALLSLTPEDDAGEHSLGQGSLVRVVGEFGDASDPSDGSPILRATYYRHWPRFFYVTKSAARDMRQ